MSARFSRFVTKFFFEILPATLATAAAGYLFGHGSSSVPAPPPPPHAAVVNPVSAEMIKMVRDDHAALIDYMKKSADAPEAKPAETKGSVVKAPAKPLESKDGKAPEARAAEKPQETKPSHAPRAAEKKPVTKPPAPAARAPAVITAAPLAPAAPAPDAATGPALVPAPAAQASASASAPMTLGAPEAPLGQIVITRPPSAPLQVTPAPTLPPLPQTTIVDRTPHPAREAAPSGGGWFSGGEPPRPPSSVPQQNFSNASDVMGPTSGQP